MTEGDILSPANLARVEERFRAAWTGARSTPFIVEAPIPAELRAEAIEIARRLSFHVLFSRCPTLAVWVVLTPLAEHYGRGDNEVYAHIERFLGKHLSDAASRDALKARYRKAARDLGIPVSGTAPTELFFAPLGPARSKHRLLADAFIFMALLRGLPPVEDTPSARTWQRRAVRIRHPAQARLYETIAFDTSAHCARRFEAWRQGADPINDNEESLFEAYTRAMHTFGRKKSDFVGPPAVFWLGDRLALQAEPSTRPQTIRTGAFPTRIKSGGVVSIDPPWPAEIPWSCGRAAEPAAFAPGEGEVLLFDAASGSLLTRASMAGPASSRLPMWVKVPRPNSAARRMNQLLGAEPIPTVNSRARPRRSRMRAKSARSLPTAPSVMNTTCRSRPAACSRAGNARSRAGRISVPPRASR